MMQNIEEQLALIKASSRDEYAKRFIVAHDGSVVLLSEIEKYNELLSIQADYLKFSSSYGEVIRTYEDMFYKTLGLNDNFEDFLSQMQKFDVKNANVIHEYLVFIGRIKEISTEPISLISEPASEEPIIEEAPVQKVTPRKAKVVRTIKVKQPANTAEDERLKPATDEPVVVEASNIPVAEKPVEEVPFGPAVYDPSIPLAVPETLVDSENGLTIPAMPTTESLGITEEELVSEANEIIDSNELDAQIAEKRAQIANLKSEVKVMKKAQRTAVWRRRKYNWKQKISGAKDGLSNLAKKAAVLKGITILENTSGRTQGYRDFYFRIANFYDSYKTRSVEVNMAEIKELNQAIGNSTDLTIEEKTRLYKKLQKLARKVEKSKAKTSGEAAQLPLSEEDVSKVLDDSEEILASFGRR